MQDVLSISTLGRGVPSPQKLAPQQHLVTRHKIPKVARRHHLDADRRARVHQLERLRRARRVAGVSGVVRIRREQSGAIEVYGLVATAGVEGHPLIEAGAIGVKIRSQRVLVSTVDRLVRRALGIGWFAETPRPVQGCGIMSYSWEFLAEQAANRKKRSRVR